MPDTVRNQFDDVLFVAAERVLTPAGTVDDSLFREHVARKVAHYLAGSMERGCVQARVHITHGHPPQRTNLKAALDEVDTVLLARVSGLRYGFGFAKPGALVRIEAEEVLKGSGGWGTRYVFVAGGEFEVGGIRICARADQWSSTPEPGDQVLLLFQADWYNLENELLAAGPTDIIPLERDKAVRLPNLYRVSDPELRGKPADEVLAAVRERLRGGGRP